MFIPRAQLKSKGLTPPGTCQLVPPNKLFSAIHGEDWRHDLLLSEQTLRLRARDGVLRLLKEQSLHHLGTTYTSSVSTKDIACAVSSVQQSAR